ncbi:MAG TPA: DUF4445 domain-containing protein [Thermodesulfobacteriaceae bacterium]|nr:DUF4445 domain-containing protein [Thermodesulfobacteriaceae bacterium]
MREHFDPVVRIQDVVLPPPSLGDNRSHELRLRSALTDILGQRPSMPLRICARLSDVLPQAGYRVRTVLCDGPCGWEVAHVSGGSATEKILGLAVDLGSTSVVFYLVDLSTGEMVSSFSRPNPQRAHGEDILDRIMFAGRGDGLRILQSEIVDLFNTSIGELSEENGMDRGWIRYVSVAGNTTMCHFLLGLDASHICREPYLPVANRFDLIRPGEIGIDVHSGAWLYCFPNVGSYFGGDLLAGILVSGMHLREEISMLVDVGTNAEVVLGNRDWLVACAGAAGPALEGGILSCGMMAQPGAIERIEIDRDSLEVRYSTIDGGPPAGLCGSGIIDLLAAMFVAGLVDPTGKLVVDRDRKRMRETAGQWMYIVASEEETAHGKPIYISQGDIKNLVRSKGAMYTILNVVIQSVGIGFQDIDTFYVAGAFGNFIDPEKAVTIGMLPDVPMERFSGLGNAAGDGAVEALRRRRAREEVEEICDKITYLEMNVRGDFMNQLTGALFLPHTDLSRFPSLASGVLNQDHAAR